MTYRRAGKEQTDATLAAAFEDATSTGIRQVVVASTEGVCGLKAAGLGRESGIEVIVVTHNFGFRTPSEVEMTDEVRRTIEALGGRVLTGTMVLRGLGSAVRRKFGISDEEMVAAVLRMFGQGMKVCVEMAAMVSDAGLVRDEDIVCVAGTGRGADTAVVISPASSNSFFDIRIRRIIVKPEEF